MNQEELLQYITAAKAKGAADEFLVNLLRDRGWPDSDVYEAFGRYYATLTGLPVPPRRSRAVGAKDAFLYLLGFSTLATWTTSLGSALFTYINRAFPDPLAAGSRAIDRYSLSSELASMIVAFPIYLLVQRRLIREMAANPDKLESGVRKWLTYIAMLIAAGIVIGDVITFLAYFLRGDLTARFVLKVLAVLMIAGGVLGYHLSAVRSAAPERGAMYRMEAILAACSAAAIVLAVAAGFWHLGGRAAQRGIESDLARINDLYAIAQEIHRSWMPPPAGSSTTLPPSLSVLPPSLRVKDPVTNAPYEYVPGQPPWFQLCSVFAAEGPYARTGQSRFWWHPQGRHCFKLSAAGPVDYPPGPVRFSQ